MDGLGFLLDVFVAAAGLAGVTFVCVAACTTGGFGLACVLTTGFLATHFFFAVDIAGFGGDFFWTETGFTAGLFAAGGPIAFGCSGKCVTSAAGFTPAAAAVLVAFTVSGAGFAMPRKSGFTTIWRS